MKNWKRHMSFLLAAVTASAVMSFPALAKTKYVTSISLKVHTDLETGDSIDDGESTSTENGSGEGTYVYSSSSRYRVVEAEWVSDKEISIGDQPKMYVWLEITDSDSDTEYKFRSSYSSGSVSVSGGEYVSSTRQGGDLRVTIRVDSVRGTYDEPEYAEWDGSKGRAVWEPGEDSSNYYDVYLYRRSTIVKKLEDYNGESYDFYPYMTQEGDYSFKVRAVPHSDSEKQYGKKSDWTESGELYIGADEVSDGSGQEGTPGNTTNGTGGVTNAGWIQAGSSWYFKYPDGTYFKDGWLKWNNVWYLFDANGLMLTGWRQKNGYWYYMNDSGAMITGWVKSGDYWYYCNPNDGGPEGAMVTNSWVTVGGLTYFINPSGIMVEGWYEVEGNWYYFQPGSGQKLVNTTVNGFVLDANGIWQH